MLRNKGEKALQVVKRSRSAVSASNARLANSARTSQPSRSPQNCTRAFVQKSIIPEALTRQYASAPHGFSSSSLGGERRRPDEMLHGVYCGHPARKDASFSSDERQPASLSSSRTPAGMLSQRMVTSVPPAAGANVVVTIISPAKAESADSNSTAHTIRSLGIKVTKRPWNVSVLSVVLPPADLPPSGYTRDMLKAPPSRASKACTTPVIALGGSQAASESRST